MARPVAKSDERLGDAEAPSRAGWGLWLAVLVAAFLRLHDLGAQSLWIDEIFTWQTASPTAPLTALDLVSNIHGPLVSAFAHFWIKLFGQSEASLRLPMALRKRSRIWS